MKTHKLSLAVLAVFWLVSGFTIQKVSETEIIDSLIDNWYKAAAEANYANYFGLMADHFIFMGTDPSERWNKEQFGAFCKSYFDQGKTWDFRKIERHIEISKDGKTAWFDEKISTWMKDCRGSGVLVKTGKEWKLAQYNLSVLIENDKIQDFIQLREKP
ncbi:nuclear transport factor 2 family protein [Fluviicola sp.]|jgi:ketosteroid isomerase-like protein|uniref:nuclear transport factor 2 family protein n=1 Tax=Fluviicola sp. TaxID=1917219 RepID=UPI002825C31F|nr:nuclear transport factor 2 family protein [Fluviicola sp.]MDR0802040.1 nuclear transport factor 2 family protein [Fluviicola sp.]